MPGPEYPQGEAVGTFLIMVVLLIGLVVYAAVAPTFGWPVLE